MKVCSILQSQRQSTIPVPTQWKRGISNEEINCKWGSMAGPRVINVQAVIVTECRLGHICDSREPATGPAQQTTAEIWTLRRLRVQMMWRKSTVLFDVPLHTVLSRTRKKLTTQMILKQRDSIILNWILRNRTETLSHSADAGLGKVADSYGSQNDSHHINGAEFLGQLSDYWNLQLSTANEQCTRNNW